MKNVLALLVVVFSLAACDTFGYAPQPFPVWTPVPSRTPGIVSPTPIIFTLAFNTTITASPTPINSETPSPTITFTPTTPSETAVPSPIPSVQIEILGCNTSFDITHGMGEVTNAYVTVKNAGNLELTSVCALLRAVDEDREHPDKKACIPNLPGHNQVTFKLTVDSAYKQDTAIQVDALSNEILLLRVDEQSCTDISLFGGAPPEVGVIKPIP